MRHYVNLLRITYATKSIQHITSSGWYNKEKGVWIMFLGTSIYYAITALIIGVLLGGIIRIILHTSNRKKQNPVEQKLDRIIQLLEKQNKD